MVPGALDISKPYITGIKEVGMSSKRYTEEFKTEAVRQVLENGRTAWGMRVHEIVAIQAIGPR